MAIITGEPVVVEGRLYEVEATVQGGGQRDIKDIRIPVSENDGALIVTLSGSGAGGWLQGPTGASVRIVDPQGRERPELVSALPNGQLHVLHHDPEPGVWIAQLVDEGRGGSAHFCGTVLVKDFWNKVRQGAAKARCRCCRFGLKGIVIVAVGHVLAGTAVPAAILGMLGSALGVSLATAKLILDLIVEVINTPLDGILEHVCVGMRMCPPKRA